MKKTTVVLAVKYNPMGFEALVTPTEDQFAFEDRNGKGKEID